MQQLYAIGLLNHVFILCIHLHSLKYQDSVFNMFLIYANVHAQ